MKKYYLNPLLAVAIMMAALTSCDIFDKVGDVTFTSDLEKSLDVNQPVPGEGVAYSETFTLDATADPEINKYKDKLKQMKVKKITYKVLDYDGEEGNHFSGSVGFAQASQSTFTITSTIMNLDLAAASATGQEFELVYNGDDITTISDLLLNDRAVKVQTIGVLDNAPVRFTLLIKVNVDITANPL